MTTFSKKALLAATALLLSGGIAHAASDGTLGGTSTGTADVTLDIGTQVQVTDFADLALGTYSGTGNLTGNDDLCVYTNDGTAQYDVTVDDNVATGGFQVADGGNEITMTASWNDASGTAGAASLTAGTVLDAQTNANTTATNCGGVLNSNISVTLLATALQAAPAGNYSTTLTVLVEPD